MGLDNVVNLNIAAVIAESDLGSVSRDIDREAGALKHVKILNDVASSFVATVNRRVDKITVFAC